MSGDYCAALVEGFNCLLLEGHKGPHSKRQAPQEPPQEKLIQILELAARPVGHLWTWIWTFSNGGWITWMVDEGLLTETLKRDGGYGYSYGGFSWSSLAPDNQITEKGRALLAYHVPAEW